MITITCKQGYIEEVRLCLSRDLDPVPCGADVIRDCTATDALFDPDSLELLLLTFARIFQRLGGAFQINRHHNRTGGIIDSHGLVPGNGINKTPICEEHGRPRHVALMNPMAVASWLLPSRSNRIG